MIEKVNGIVYQTPFAVAVFLLVIFILVILSIVTILQVNKVFKDDKKKRNKGYNVIFVFFTGLLLIYSIFISVEVKPVEETYSVSNITQATFMGVKKDDSFLARKSDTSIIAIKGSTENVPGSAKQALDQILTRGELKPVEGKPSAYYSRVIKYDEGISSKSTGFFVKETICHPSISYIDWFGKWETDLSSDEFCKTEYTLFIKPPKV